MAKILIVDDYEDNLYVASLVLARDHHEISTASNGFEAIEKAEALQPDVILLDIQLPEIDGFEVCRRLKASPTTSQIPVVFLTAKYKDSDSLAKGLALGAEDYIVKPFSNPELRARVKVMARLKAQMDELGRKNQELALLNQQLEHKNQELVIAQKALEELAVTDPLTGVYNRRYFTERLNEEFARAMRHEHTISLIMLDIDFFKRVNDTYGHQCGDSVLIQFANILKRNVRQHDIVARYGGEEFVIGMTQIDRPFAVTIAERIRQDVATHLFKHDELTLSVTTSLGVGTFPELCANNPRLEALLREVDNALYCAKKTGRNRTIWAPMPETLMAEGELPSH